MGSTTLSGEARQAALAAMGDDEGLDVLVVGGGITGAGIALDAATRGLRTGIVEAQDWASGTSSRSSRLVHGGLRYLQMLDFALVHEALTERGRLLTELAPHLVQRVPFLFPLTHRVIDRAYIGAGVALYDVLANTSRRRRAVPFHRHLSKTRLLSTFPDLDPKAAVGALQYWDARVDDARLVTTIVRTAAGYGALAANRTSVVELVREGERVVGAVLEDGVTGERSEVRARSVINATGVWTEETEKLAGGEGSLRVLASKGIHILVPRDRIKGDAGLILQTEKSVLFIIPWERYWLIGTTDTPYTEDLKAPVVTSTDIDYVLDHANAVLADPLSRDDIIGSFAGLRPLLQPGTKEGASSSKISREHTVASPAPGLTAIAGGKLTTYRVMAADAVDFALGKEARVLPSVTERIPLAGAVGFAAARRRLHRNASRHGWKAATVDHLVRRYGSLVTDIEALVAEQPDLAEPVSGAQAYLRAEIVYAATHEAVVHLEDVLVRRTRIAQEIPDRGLAAAAEIADLVAPHLGWDDDRIQQELRMYAALCRGEEAASHERDDVAAARVWHDAVGEGSVTALSS